MALPAGDNKDLEAPASLRRRQTDHDAETTRKSLRRVSGAIHPKIRIRVALASDQELQAGARVWLRPEYPEVVFSGSRCVGRVRGAQTKALEELSAAGYALIGVVRGMTASTAIVEVEAVNDPRLRRGLDARERAFKSDLRLRMMWL
ncbi:MAG: hypothetical protein QM648_10655 [Solirubrobacterales bacterium]